MPCVSSFSRYQTKRIIKFSFLSLTQRFILDPPLKQLYSSKNGVEDGNTKVSTSEEQRKISRWSKNNFSLLFKGYRIVKEENSGHKL